jgi:hypothetical protein
MQPNTQQANMEPNTQQLKPLTFEELEEVVKQLCDENPQGVEKLLKFQKWNWIFYNDQAKELNKQTEHLNRAIFEFSDQVKNGAFEYDCHRMRRAMSLDLSMKDIDKRRASLKGDFEQLTSLDTILERYKM